MQFKALCKARCNAGSPIKQLLRTMKITAIILLAACLQVSARGYSQAVTFSGENVSLIRLFSAIEKQTGYVFFFDGALLREVNPVTIDVKNVSVNEVLDRALRGQQLDYSIENKTITIVKKLLRPSQVNVNLPPPIDVRGKVVNEKGEPVIATVTVKGTKNAVSTNEGGEFTISGVDPNATLVITGVGIETFEVRVDNRNDLATLSAKIRIAESETVNVFVNTGYQQLPKERATGSFDFIDNKTLNQQVGSNILDRLNGVASGVLFPTGKVDAPTLMIRGLSTINGPKSPLIVVDNFPYDGDINNINPNDVENITILKDAAAASIWGTKAGNGVIVITTKKGRFNQPLQVEFNSNVSISQKPNLFYVPQISSSDYIDLEQFLYNNGYYDGQINDPSYPGLSPAVETFIKRTNGLISAADSASYINALKKVNTRNEYNKYFYQKSINQQYSMNLKGGSDKMSYFLSGGFDKNIDNLAARYQRINLHAENKYKPVKNLELSLGLLFTNSITQSGKPAYGSVRVGTSLIVPYLSFADANANPLPVAKDSRLGYIDTLGGGYLLDGHYYPLTNWQHNTATTNLQDLTANIGLQYTIIKGLTVDVKYLYEKQQFFTKNLEDADSYEARSLINLFSQIDRSSDAISYVVPIGGILNQTQSSIETHNFRGQLSFNHTWNKHNVTAILGSEVRESKTLTNGYTVYGYNDKLQTYSNVDFVNYYPTISGGSGSIPSGISFQGLLNRYVSFYGNGAYTYNNKYTFSISGRRDASNLFGVNTNDKWNPLWSTGLSWDVYKESFYKSNLFPFLKLRATYGYSGNADPTRAAVTTLGINSGQLFTNVNYAQPTNYANPELRWERVKTVNIGIDFGLRNKLITGSFEYYHKNGVDLFGPTPLDYTTGLLVSFIDKNVASMAGNGIDVSLQSVNISRKFRWTTNFLLSYYTDKITDYYYPSSFASALINGGENVNSIVGKPVYSIVSYKWAGLNGSNGNPQGYLNGSVSEDYDGIAFSNTSTGFKGLDNLLVYSGSALPKFFGSLMNTFACKGFSLSININYKIGYYFRKVSLDYSHLFTNGAYAGSGDYAKRWQHSGDELKTNIPSLAYPEISNRDAFYSNSEATVLKADNIRLQFINLSYEIRKAQFPKLPFSSAQLYLNGSNLGILWKANREGIDPDFGTGIPAPKNIAIGLRAYF